MKKINKLTRFTIIICLLIITIVCVNYKFKSNAESSVIAPEFVQCNAKNYTYIFKSADNSSEQLGISYRGYVHKLLDSEGDFYKVKYFTSDKKNIEGYVSKKFFQKVNPRLGIDVSKWQKSIDWGRVADSKLSGYNIDFAIIRLGYSTDTGSCCLDETFKNNIVSAYENNIDVGVYFYSKAKTVSQAKKEADYVLEQLKPYKNYVSMPVVFDYEEASIAKTLSASEIHNIYSAFIQPIKSAGYTARIYACENFILNYTNRRDYPCRLWIAKYTASNDTENDSLPLLHSNNMWQFSSSGDVDGINGRVDLNWDLSNCK